MADANLVQAILGAFRSWDQGSGGGFTRPELRGPFDTKDMEELAVHVAEAMEPLASALGGLERLMGALRDIAELDTDPHSPNSVNWRATLLYATQRAGQVLEATTSG